MKRDLLKRAIPTVLSVFGVGGVFGTAVLAVMATPKAERIIAEKKKEKEAPLTKKEIVKAVWKNYIPAAVIGVSSAICIASANILNRKQINSLNGALAIMAGTYNRYKDKIKELFGDEAHEKVMLLFSSSTSNFSNDILSIFYVTPQFSLHRQQDFLHLRQAGQLCQRH